jgi:hypothetical protein
VLLRAAARAAVACCTCGPVTAGAKAKQSLLCCNRAVHNHAPSQVCRCPFTSSTDGHIPTPLVNQRSGPTISFGKIAGMRATATTKAGGATARGSGGGGGGGGVTVGA